MIRSETITRFLVVLITIPILYILWENKVVSHKLSWIVHGTFAFILTLLIFGAFTKGKYTIAYVLFFITLAVGWEIVEFFILGQRVENSLILTAFDTIMDITLGLAGVGIGIYLIKLVKKYLTRLR